VSDNSAIEWTDSSWPVTVGCDHVSPGCDHCYAATLASGRLKNRPPYDGIAEGGRFNGTVRCLPERLDWPPRWRKPRRIFVCSMSDLFHESVPDEFIAQVFTVMARAPQHTFQVLSKRHSRMRSLLGMDGQTMIEAAPDEATALALYEAEWPLPNVWLGVSVEDQKWADIRIPALRETPAAVRFLSCEPLLGPLGRLDLDGIGWVIVGGESGPSARFMDLDWAVDIVRQCRDAAVPVFVKQLGTVFGGRRHHDIETFPVDLRVREYPQTAVSA
jgi:protein gp37